MKVSLITPTFQREQFHPRIFRCFESQTYPDVEWLLLDDSPSPSRFLSETRHDRVKYFHVPERMRIGDKRNWLAERSSGDLIVHFDDDDFYVPNYVSEMVTTLRDRQLDLMNLRGWFILDRRCDFFGYWDLSLQKGHHFICEKTGVKTVDVQSDNYFGDNELGWGFGFIYRKSLWEQIRFPSQDWNEDGEFSKAAHARFRAGGKIDTQGICLHEIHGGNSSRSFPQFRMPSFMLDRIFPDYRAA